MGNEYINAGCSALTVGIVRAAIDKFGEDCEMSGHPAQRAAWEMQALLLGDLDWQDEQKERMKAFWLGQKFNVEPQADKTKVFFVRNGVVVGMITCLAIPVAYA